MGDTFAIALLVVAATVFIWVIVPGYLRVREQNRKYIANLGAVEKEKIAQIQKLRAEWILQLEEMSEAELHTMQCLMVKNLKADPTDSFLLESVLDVGLVISAKYGQN